MAIWSSAQRVFYSEIVYTKFPIHGAASIVKVGPDLDPSHVIPYLMRKLLQLDNQDVVESSWEVNTPLQC